MPESNHPHHPQQEVWHCSLLLLTLIRGQDCWYPRMCKQNGKIQAPSKRKERLHHSPTFKTQYNKYERCKLEKISLFQHLKNPIKQVSTLAISSCDSHLCFKKYSTALTSWLVTFSIFFISNASLMLNPSISSCQYDSAFSLKLGTSVTSGICESHSSHLIWKGVSRYWILYDNIHIKQVDQLKVWITNSKCTLLLKILKHLFIYLYAISSMVFQTRISTASVIQIITNNTLTIMDPCNITFFIIFIMNF